MTLMDFLAYPMREPCGGCRGRTRSLIVISGDFTHLVQRHKDNIGLPFAPNNPHPIYAPPLPPNIQLTAPGNPLQSP